MISIYVLILSFVSVSAAEAEVAHPFCQVEVSGLPILKEKASIRRQMIGNLIDQLSDYGQPVVFLLDADQASGAIVISSNCGPLLEKGYKGMPVTLAQVDDLMEPKCTVDTEINFENFVPNEIVPEILNKIRTEAELLGYPFGNIKLGGRARRSTVQNFQLEFELYLSCDTKQELVTQVLDNVIAEIGVPGAQYAIAAENCTN